MKKQIISSILALAMIASLGVTAFATEVTAPGNATTAVTYNGSTSDNYTVTIPSTMTPGSSAEVTAEGTWASNKTLIVTADKKVVLYSELDASAIKELVITFPFIEEKGNNGEVSNATSTVEVEDISGIALGNWSGEFIFNIELESLFYGDVNMDGIINNDDAQMILNYGAELITLTPEQKVRADVTGNGIVNADDASEIWEYEDNSITEFSVETLTFGDINDDGIIDQADVNLLYEHIAAADTLSGSSKVKADVNRDGTIDMLDAIAIQGYISGNLHRLPK